jgi:hypothetical protein
MRSVAVKSEKLNPEQQAAFTNLVQAMRDFDSHALLGRPTIEDAQNLEIATERVLVVLLSISNSPNIKALARKAFADALRLASLESLSVSHTSEDSPLFGGVAHV